VLKPPVTKPTFRHVCLQSRKVVKVPVRPRADADAGRGSDPSGGLRAQFHKEIFTLVAPR